MADLDSYRLLPPFAIRDLNGPYVPPGVIHISASQYDDTVHTQPDAVLSYVDLDDGEVITVGSSFELQQRLDEPAPKATIPVSPHPNPAMRPQENKMMHIFDIKQTSTSLAVWREHAAGSRKSWVDPVLSNSDSNNPTESPAASPEPQTAANASTTKNDQINISASPTHSIPEAEALIPAQMDKYIADVFNRLESRLGPLADFLDSTANGLRKIAEKTAESDTTPVENVLHGFKGILTEVGEFGAEFFSTLSRELESNNAATISIPTEFHDQKSEDTLSSSETPAQAEKTSTKPPTLSKAESPTKKVAFVEARPALFTQQPQHSLDLGRQSPGSSASKPFAPIITPQYYPPVPYKPKVWTRPSAKESIKPGPTEPAKNSIIDSEPADPDFSIRYPPLPMLRKAVSVGGLLDKTKRPVPPPSGMNPMSAMSRYPSIGQFEEQTRPKSSHKPGSQVCPDDAAVAKDAPPKDPVKPKKTDIYKKPAVEDEVVPTQSKPEVDEGSAQWPPTSLPGAWPAPALVSNVDDWNSALPRNVPSSGKSTMAAVPKPKTSTAENVSEGLSYRISSPVSDTLARKPIFPRKSQTVHDTNPAARLNGPFDPLAHIPVLQPRPQRSQPDLAARSKLTSEKEKDDHTRPYGLPQRARTVHHTDHYKPQDSATFCSPFTYSRPTLWEAYVKDNSSSTSGYASKPQPSYPRVPYPSSGSVMTGSGLPNRRPDVGQGQSSSTQHRDLRHMRSAPILPPATTTKSITTAGMARAPPFSATHAAVRPQSLFIPGPAVPSNAPRAPPPVPSGSIGVDECVKTLKLMGFGSEDNNELSRLNVYASVAAGDIEAAIEMIEEDREAGKALEESSQVEGVLDLSDEEKFY